MAQSPIHGMLWIWFAVLIAALGLALAVAADRLPDEARAVREIQSWAFPGQTLSDAVRAVTGTAFVVAAGLAIAALHWLTGNRRAAGVLVVALLVLLGLQATLKEAVDRPRPSETAAGVEVRASQTSPSFPAGHVMGPVVVYGWAVYFLLRRGEDLPSGQKAAGAAWTGASPAPAAGTARHRVLWRGVAGVFLVVIALTGIVNVWLGVHWPSDVLGGYLWGAVLLLPALALAGGRIES